MGKWSLSKEKKRHLIADLDDLYKKRSVLQGQYENAMGKAIRALENGDDETAKMYLAVAEHIKAQIELAGACYDSNLESVEKCEKISATSNTKYNNWLGVVGNLLTGAAFGTLTYNLQKEALRKAYENDKGGELVNKKTLGFFNNLPNPLRGLFMK